MHLEQNLTKANFIRTFSLDLPEDRVESLPPSEVEKYLFFENPRWRPELVGGHTNFASFHRRTKILVPKYMFSRSRNRMKVLPKPYARYFSWIRRFFAFSAVFKHFSQYFSLMTPVFKIIGPVIRFCGTSNVKKQFPTLFARYFRLIRRFFS